MKYKGIIKKLSNRGLALLEKNANKKANAECLGYLYEPKVPKKLKKTICMMLACVLTVTGVVAGNVYTFKAADSYDYRSWTTRKPYASSSLHNVTVSLYNTNEVYEWAVTSHTLGKGYGMVTLYGINNDIVMISGSNQLTEEGTRRFYRKNPDTSHSDYMQFGITMTMEDGGYLATYSGYVQIIKNVYP